MVVKPLFEAFISMLLANPPLPSVSYESLFLSCTITFVTTDQKAYFIKLPLQSCHVLTLFSLKLAVD